ncbi:MAG: hypothetical protein PHS02_02965, partial [Candidatus ainarchaeum sp.]|nr:hypothetical protein [Candidatus ainarchaeum sp.]
GLAMLVTGAVYFLKPSLDFGAYNLQATFLFLAMLSVVCLGGVVAVVCYLVSMTSDDLNRPWLASRDQKVVVWRSGWISEYLQIKVAEMESEEKEGRNRILLRLAEPPGGSIQANPPIFRVAVLERRKGYALVAFEYASRSLKGTILSRSAWFWIGKKIELLVKEDKLDGMLDVLGRTILEFKDVK